jgi:phenylacetate-CoA ligase
MSIDFRIRDFFHPHTIWQIHRSLERTQWLPPDELEEYQESRLARVLDQAFRQVPYYRDLLGSLGLQRSDFRSAGDLRHLPVLTKDTVQNRSEALVAANAPRYSPTTYNTSGTSGKPLHFYLDRGANALEFAYYWRHWSWGGFKLGNRFAELNSHYFLKRPALADAPFRYQPHLRRLLMNSGQISRGRTRILADAIRRYRPRFLKGLASALYFLALTLQEARISDIRFECVFSTGELVTKMHRGLIESVFGCRLLDSYGHMERTVAISECLQGGYHINSDYGLMQFEDLRPSEDGTGTLARVIGTSLYNFAMPLIRYDVGDEVELLPDERRCPCGRSLPLVAAIRGRCQDIILTPEGNYVTALFIVPELVRGVRFIQFVQDREDQLEVRLVPSPMFSDETSRHLLVHTRRLVGERMHVRVRIVEDADLIRDRSGKVRSVIGYDWTGSVADGGTAVEERRKDPGPSARIDKPSDQPQE